MKIIDFVSDDLNVLLSTIDGKKVKTVAGERILKTAHVNVVREEMSLDIRFSMLLQTRMSPICSCFSGFTDYS